MVEDAVGSRVGHIDASRQAVDDYRRTHGIDDEILEIDGAGSHWRRDF